MVLKLLLQPLLIVTTKLHVLHPGNYSFTRYCLPIYMLADGSTKSINLRSFEVFSLQLSRVVRAFDASGLFSSCANRRPHAERGPLREWRRA